jgi:hypothetical protein
MEQIDDGRDDLVVQCCHQAMAVKPIGDLPKPLGKVVCTSCDLLAVRIIYNYLLLSTPQNTSSDTFV